MSIELYICLVWEFSYPTISFVCLSEWINQSMVEGVVCMATKGGVYTAIVLCQSLEQTGVMERNKL